MKDELEWKNARGIDVLVEKSGRVIAQCRKTHEDLYVAQYGLDPQQTYFSRDQARRAMLDRHEEIQKALAEQVKKDEKKKDDKEKEKGNAGKN